VLVSTTPDSGAVLEQVPDHVDLAFDEVVNERTVANPPTITSAVIVSPSTGRTRVSWKRNRLEAKPARDFEPGRIYRVELLPVVTDLRQNRMHTGRVIVFSTGPAIPDAVLEGAAVDWAGGRAAPLALIEAVLLPDSLPYRTLADSTGWFRMAHMPAGTYLVYGIMDTNGDRQRGAREAYDTVRVEVADTGRVELYAFAHDTLGPRIRQVEAQDSLTVRLTFDRPIDPAFVFDTALVTLATAEDTTTRIPFAGIYSQAQVDAMRARADSLARAQRDSIAAAAAAAAEAAKPAAAAPEEPVDPRAGRRRFALAAPQPAAAPPRPAPLDSTVAQRMLARRPAPTDVRLLRLTEPLTVDVRYVILLDSVRGLTGALARSRGQIRIARPRNTTSVAPGPGASGPLVPDTGRADTTVRDSATTRP